MVPYPRIMSIDPARFSAMIEEFRAYSETEEKKMPIDNEPQEYDDEEWNADLYYDTMYDGQPDELTEWNDFDPDC